MKSTQASSSSSAYSPSVSDRQGMTMKTSPPFGIRTGEFSVLGPIDIPNRRRITGHPGFACPGNCDGIQRQKQVVAWISPYVGLGLGPGRVYRYDKRKKESNP